MNREGRRTDRHDDLPANQGLAELAVEWAQRGVAVFPVALGRDSAAKSRKRPLPMNGHLSATTDAYEVHRMFGRVHLLPGEVLGIGGVPGSAGFVVFDLDRHGGPDGVAYGLEVLDLPRSAYRHVTGSGGLHVWLLKPDAEQHVGNASPWHASGVDVRSDAGWVVLHARTPWGHWDIAPGSPAWGEASELVPAALWEAISAPASLARARAARSANGHAACLKPMSAHEGVDTLIEQVRNAEEGVRNDTLNRCTFVAALRGSLTPEVREQFIEAALLSGLHLVEIESTIDSAATAVAAKRAFALEWIDQAIDVARLKRPRSVLNVELTARLLGELHMSAVAGQRPGLSVRQLAEEIGVARTTAGKVLRFLIRSGLLVATSPRNPEHAREFTLVLDRHRRPRGDTHPKEEPLGRVSTFGHDHVHRALAQRKELARRLKCHPAFLRVDRGEVLPPTAIDVLVALSETSMTRDELVHVTGRSRRAVLRCVSILERDGLVAVDEASCAACLAGDVFDLLDLWVLDRGVAGRGEVRVSRHAKERAAYRWGIARGRRPRPTGRHSTHRKGGE